MLDSATAERRDFETRAWETDGQAEVFQSLEEDEDWRMICFGESGCGCGKGSGLAVEKVGE